MKTQEPTTDVARPDWLPVSEYPFTLRNLDLDAESVTYVDEGEGPTILFVHTGMWSFIFRDVITKLSGDFRCITLDFPGYGLSPEPSGDELDLEAQSDLLGQFVAKLGLDELTMVLHDLGGVVGTGFAASNPGLIKGMVMSNTFAWKPDTKKLTRMLGIASSRLVTAVDWSTRVIPRMTTTGSGVGLHLTRAGKDAFLGPFMDRKRITRFHSLLRDALSAEQLYGRIENSLTDYLGAVPVLTIFGERNDPFGFQDRHHSIFADHEGLVIEKGNHFPMMDDPDLFTETVREWHQRKVEPLGSA